MSGRTSLAEDTGGNLRRQMLFGSVKRRALEQPHPTKAAVPGPAAVGGTAAAHAALDQFNMPLVRPGARYA
jgi:hypothetical protein